MPLQWTLCRIAFGFNSKKLPKKVEKILFFKIGALGDVLMTTPLVREIRARYPKATIDYACGKSYANVLFGNKNINFVLSFDERMFHEKNTDELKQLRKRLKENKYDVIFVLDKHWGASIFAALAGGFKIGFNRSGEGFANNANVIYNQQKHDIESYLDLGLFFGIKSRNTKMEMYISDKCKKFAKGITSKNTIAIAPGGGVNTGQNARIKVWPKERFLAAIDKLGKKNNIILLGNNKDLGICNWIYSKSKQKGKIKNLCAKTTIMEAAAILEQCKLVICNDSGLMHVASCTNNRIISLFGPTNPKVLAPLNKGSVYIWKEQKACYDMYGKFDSCDKMIMKKITVEDVLNAAKKFVRF